MAVAVMPLGGGLDPARRVDPDPRRGPPRAKKQPAAPGGPGPAREAPGGPGGRHARAGAPGGGGAAGPGAAPEGPRAGPSGEPTGSLGLASGAGAGAGGTGGAAGQGGGAGPPAPERGAASGSGTGGGEGAGPAGAAAAAAAARAPAQGSPRGQSGAELAAAVRALEPHPKPLAPLQVPSWEAADGEHSEDVQLSPPYYRKSLGQSPLRPGGSAASSSGGAANFKYRPHPGAARGGKGSRGSDSLEGGAGGLHGEGGDLAPNESDSVSHILSAAESAHSILRTSGNLIDSELKSPKLQMKKEKLSPIKLGKTPMEKVDQDSPEMRERRRQQRKYRVEMEERKAKKLEAQKQRSEELTRLLEQQDHERMFIIESRIQQRQDAIRQRLLFQQEEKMKRDAARKYLNHEAKRSNRLISTPLYKKMESDFKNKYELPEIERRKNALKERKQRYRPLDMRNMQRHAENVERRQAEMKMHKKQERLRERKAMGRVEEEPAYYQSRAQRRIIEEKRKQREAEMKEEQEKKSRLRRRNNYSKFVREVFLPPVDARKRIEVEQRSRKPKARKPVEFAYRISDLFSDRLGRHAKNRDRGEGSAIDQGFPFEGEKKEEEYAFYKTVKWEEDDIDAYTQETIDDIRNQLAFLK